jgi:Ca2+-binding RTX toxin-like protein
VLGYDSDIYAQALTPAGVESGPQFRVHSHTQAYQQAPSITALASGGYVVIWEDGLEYEGGLLGQAFDSNGAPAGNLFRVTTTIWGDQAYAAITALPGGGFVAVWDNYDTEYGAHSTRGQIFTGAGVKVGPEFRVSADSEWMQYPAAIDDLPGGGFVVTWYDRGGQDGDSSEGAIMAQVFDPAGAKVGSPFLVNSVTSGNQNMPAVAGLASGGFAIAWTNGSDGRDVKAQIFMPLTGAPTDLALSPGAVLEASISNYAVATFSHDGAVNSPMTYELLADSTGGGFRIEGNRLVVADNRRLDHETAPTASLTVRVTDANGNSYQEVISVAIADSVFEDRYSAGADFTGSSTTTGSHAQAAIGALTSGGYVMAWVHADSQGSNDAVRAQMFDANGAKVGGELNISPAAAADPASPAAAGLASGGFVIVWKDWRATSDDSEFTEIRGQRFDSAGARVGEEFLVNTITARWQIEPTVTALSSGGFVVAWTDQSNSTADDFYNGDVRAQMYDASGAKVGGELLVNSITYAEQSSPAIAGLPGGGFIVTWTDRGNDAVAAQRFDSAGNKVGGEIQLPAGFEPAVAVLASGGFVISWTGNASASGYSGSYSVLAQVFDANGAKLGGVFLVGTETPDSQALSSVSARPGGGFVISWQEGWDEGATVRAQMFDSAGARIGEEFIVPAGARGSQHAPASALLSSGSFVIGWTDQGAVSVIEGRLFTLVEADNSGNDILIGDPNANRLDGQGGNDQLYGLGGDDELIGGAGDDLLDGGSSGDTMTGGAGNDVYVVDSLGDSVVEQAGEGTDEIRTALATYSLAALPNVENLTGTSAAGQDLRGNSGNNAVTGGSGNDVLRLQDGGDDTVLAGAGNDTLFFIGSLTAADVVNGGAGVDTLVLQGPYGSLALTANVTQIENISILGGGNTGFGEPGTNRHDYVLTTHDANFAAGVQARINASALLAEEDFTFDGSAETDASYVVYGGRGKDTLTGGQGHDIFFFAEGRFADGDTVNGGSGYDGMFLRGNYTIDFTALGYTGLFTSIENLTLSCGDGRALRAGGGTEFDYSLVLSDAIVGAGQQLTVNGTGLTASESMILDASRRRTAACGCSAARPPTC